MSKEFVERRDGSFYLIGSRVPLAFGTREKLPYFARQK
jgi:hypothetical protein